MPRRRDGGLVPGTPALAGDADRRAGEEATDSIMALQLPVAPAPAAGTDHTAAPWLAKPQLKPADCVPEESVGAYDLLRRYGVAAAPAGADSARLLQDGRSRARCPDLGAEAAARRALWSILGHHYQRDEVIQFADFRGDSFKLSQQAAGRATPNSSSSAASTSWPRAPTSSPGRTSR